MRFLIITISIAAWAGLLVGGVMFAAQTSTVTATVTAQNLSVGVYDGTVAYGSITLSSSKDTVTDFPAEGQDAQNEGNVAENFNIQGKNTTVGSPTWTLATAIGTNQYKHEVSTDGGSVWAPLTTSYLTMVASKAVSGTQSFDLKITVPSATTNYNQQDPDVTVQAVAG